MDIVEFVEKVMGLELFQYQKEILKNLEKYKDCVPVVSPITGRIYFLPRKKEVEL